MPLSNRTFGIEVEFKSLHRSAAVAALRDAGLNAEYAGYTHATTPYWKIVSDASVPGGYELVSPVLSGDAGLADAIKAVNALAAAGATVDRTCGLHVHFGADDLMVDDLKKLACNLLKYEDLIDWFMPRSRRDTNAYYCRSHQAAFGAIGTDAERIAATNAGIALIKRARSISDVVAAVNPNFNRFYKCNMTPLLHPRRANTIEFRHHSGTVDAEKLSAWVRFLDAWIAYSINLKSVAKRNPDRPNPFYNRLYSLFNPLCKVDPDLYVARDYYRNRRKQFETERAARR